MRCAKREPGRSWEAIESELLKLGEVTCRSVGLGTACESGFGLWGSRSGLQVCLSVFGLWGSRSGLQICLSGFGLWGSRSGLKVWLGRV
jgi:hypothetical protein